MEEKLQRITLWLNKIYENQPIPQYEVNARTVDILYDLVECSEARDRDASLLIEDMKQRAAEYEAEANYLQGLLAESLDLSLSSLSVTGISNLDVLVNSAMALETKDTSLARSLALAALLLNWTGKQLSAILEQEETEIPLGMSQGLVFSGTGFFGAINDMTLEMYTTESKNREMKLELANIGKKLTAALMLEEQLKQDLKTTEELLQVAEDKARSQDQTVKFLNEKCSDLKDRIKVAEEQLSAMRLDQSLTHESLVSLSEELARLQEEIVPLKKQLEFYLDLTPNPLLAQVKIEEVKRELDALEAEFSEEVDVLSLEMAKSSKFP
ncbi:HAUS augmin-like complex subunit 1 [Leptosomus discolor]